MNYVILYFYISSAKGLFPPQALFKTIKYIFFRFWNQTKKYSMPNMNIVYNKICFKIQENGE